MYKKIIEKSWGREIIIVNSKYRDYCGKILECENDIWSSGGKFHKHKVKDETFYVIDGYLELDLIEKETGEIVKKILAPTDSIRLAPNTWHRFKSRTFCQFAEFSTYDSVDDSYRKSYKEIE